MLIDLVIPTYNREYLLKSALESVILAINKSLVAVNVIIADNNSSDGTKNMVNFFIKENPDLKIKYIFESQQGVAFARNCGLYAATGDYLVYMDDEQEMDQNYFEQLLLAFNETNADCIGGKIVYKNSENLPDWILPLISDIGCLDLGSKILELNGKKPLLKEGNIAFKTASLLAVGGFDTGFGRKGNELLAGEGDELQSRMVEKGYKIAYSPYIIQYNYVLPNKLNKSYWRHHAIGSGKTNYLMNREGWKNANRCIGVPRSLYLEFLSYFLKYIKSFYTLNSAKIFQSELEVWRIFGNMLESRRHCND